MPTTIEEALLPEWTEEGWGSYTVPLGPNGLTWTPTPRRPVADPVRADRESIDMTLADPPWVEGEGWATVYVPTTGPMTWRSPRLAKMESRPRQAGPTSGASATGSGRHRYREVASAPRSLRQASQAALNLAAAELGLRRPGLRWFAASGPKDTATFTSNKDISGRIGAVDFTVWLRIGLGAGEAIRTAAHEARHFWQLIRGSPREGDPRAIEADAERYVRSFWARHGSRLMSLAA